MKKRSRRREVPLCVNCKCYKDGYCLHNPSPVDGKARVLWRGYPESLRQENYLMAIIFNTCGRSGRWFEPKDPS